MATRYKTSTSTAAPSQRIPQGAPAPAAAQPARAASSGGLFGGVLSGVNNAAKQVSTALAPVVQRQAAERQAGIDSNTPDTIDQQTGAARALGAGIQQQGTGIFNQQGAAADNFAQQGQNYNATSQSITAPGGMGGGNAAVGLGSAGRSTGSQMLPPGAPGGMLQLGGGLVNGGRLNQGPGSAGAPAPAPAGPAAFQTGQRATAGNMGSVSNVNPASLGGYSSVMGGLGAAPGAVSTAGMAAPGSIAGQLGAAPGAISTGQLGGYSTVGGQLGGAPQVGGVGNVAGQLGGAPQVGNVGNIQMGGGPGMVQGTFGNQGQSSADQQGMMGRLNSFLDGPEGPSVAEAQLREAQATNMGQMIGMARSGRGGAGAQAQALAGAMSEGGAISSQTAGQMATLRAQEADMLKNRQLSAIGLGGEMSTAARGQDLSFRGQNLAAAQGDQSTQLGARGQDLQGAMANQSTQTQLEQLRASTALGARGQDLSALQGDQGTQLGLRGLEANTALGARGQDLNALLGDQSASIAARGQNLGALQSNQQTALGARGQNLGALSQDQSTQLATRGQDINVLQGNQATALGARGQDLSGLTADQGAGLTARGQNLSAMQGNQAAQLGARGQNVTQEGNILGANTALRGQDLTAVTGDADRNLAAQQLSLQGQLGFGGLQNEATGQGLQFLGQANQQALMGEGMAQAATSDWNNMVAGINNTNVMADAAILQANNQIKAQPSFWERMGVAGVGGAMQGLGGGASALSDERAKTDIHRADSPIDAHLRGAPGYRYRYREGFGEDTEAEHAGPMAQDLERGPFGKALVKKGADGYRRVDTGRLTLVNHAALSSMRGELDRIKESLGL
jgi:hypothetical protein